MKNDKNLTAPSEAPVNFTAFEGHRRIASGPLTDIAQALKSVRRKSGEAVLVFNDLTGRIAETEGLDRAGAGRAGEMPTNGGGAVLTRGPGRPRLGVISREITLLPDHWDWLNIQPGGASAALRRLVYDAKRSGQKRDRARQSQEAVYHFMTVMAGNFPSFEEALRAFYRRDFRRLGVLIRTWPKDIRRHVRKMVFTARRDDVGAEASK